MEKNRKHASTKEKSPKKKIQKKSQKSEEYTRRRRSLKRPIIAGIVIVALLLLVTILPFIFSKSPMQSLISFAKSDETIDSFRHSPSVAVISASDGESKAETFRASGNNLDEALSRLSKRVQQSEKYKNYVYFRLDVAPFSVSVADDIIAGFPDLSNHSFFIATGSKPYDLSEPPSLSTEDVQNMLVSSNYYLANQIQESGKFVYGYYLDNEELLEGYSIPRHAGTITAMLSAYSLHNDEWILSKIESALDYLETYVGHIEYEDSTYGFVGDYDSDGFTLVSSALSALAYADYAYVANSGRYNDVLRSIVDGIRSLRTIKEDSSCYGNFLYLQELTSDFVISGYGGNYSRWYDGQATYALVKSSQVLNDDSLLDEALNNLDDFIEYNYVSDSNTHWTVYAVASYLAIRPDSDEKYYQLAIDLVTPFLSNVKDLEYTDPTNFEALTLVQKVIELADKQEITLKLSSSFREDLEAAIINQLETTASDYRPISYTMFNSFPSKFAGSFSVAEDNNRTRIDDNQHRMAALFNYLQLAEE